MTATYYLIYLSDLVNTKKGLSNNLIIIVYLAELPQPVEIVEDGVFWSSALEARVSPGPSDAQVQDELQALRSRRVTRLAEPDWVGCLS